MTWARRIWVYKLKAQMSMLGILWQGKTLMCLAHQKRALKKGPEMENIQHLKKQEKKRMD